MVTRPISETLCEVAKGTPLAYLLRIGGVIDTGGSSESLNELGWNAVGSLGTILK